MELKSLLVDSKTTWAEFPGLLGFEVELANLSRKELTSLRKKCTINKFNRKTRQFEDELNDEKFVVEFTKATVKNWKGLKLEYLQDLLLVDLKDQNPEDEMEFSETNAQVLVENSSEFDNWLNEVVFDLENFRSKEQGKAPKRLEVFLDNKDIGMTKDQYLEMMDQMEEEPDWEKCPPDWEDFPELTVKTMNIFYSMGDRIYPDIGYIGKDYTNFDYLMEHYGVEEHQKEYVFETLLFLDSRAIEASQKKLKAEYDRMKRKS